MSSLRLTSLLFCLALLFCASVSRAQYPNVVAPPENPLTADKAVLGKMLFWDEQLSATNTVACGTCHIPSAGGSDPRSAGLLSMHPGPDGIFGTGDDARGSKGVRAAQVDGHQYDDGTFYPEVQVTGRKAPSFIDAAFYTDLFWDGRATSQFINPETGAVSIAAGGALESQAVGPILSNVEMAHDNRNWAMVADKLTKVKPLRLATNLTPDILAALSANSSYPALFNQAFGSTQITAERIAFAIASYERTLVSDQTPWDDFMAGNANALTPAQQNGWAIFNNAGRCNLCHPAPFFADNQFRNIGMVDPNVDRGREAITGLPTDLGRFKTPSLRNVGLREAGGLAHAGSGLGQDLATIMALYNLGGAFFQNLDSDMQPLGLSASQRADVIDFMRNGLTDPRVANETAPFDRPTLRSEIQATQPNANIIPIGFPDSQGNVPRMIVDEPCNVGHPFYTVGISGAWGGLDAYLVVGGPNYLNEVLFGQVPFAVGGQGPPQITKAVLTGPLLTYGVGHQSLTVGIPEVPALAGYTFWMQWVVLDPVPLIDPNTGMPFAGAGISTSDGAMVSILP